MRFRLFVAAASLAIVPARSSGGAADAIPAPPLPLELDHVIESRLAPDASQSYTVAMVAGQIMDVAAERRDADVALKLVGPDERTLVETTEPRLLWIADTGGTYRLEV